MGKPVKSKRVTQRDIAKKIGISVAAVSRALAEDPLISADTRVSVQQVADNMGYVPDRAAQRLRTGRTNVICLILPPHEEILSFSTSLVRGITLGLEKSQYHLVVLPDFNTETSDSTIRRVVENGLADGVLLSKSEPNDIRIRYLIESDFPFVCHGRTELATQHPYVDFDNYQFAYQSVTQLIAKGADKMMILLPPDHLTFHHHLWHGFRDSARKAGVAFEKIEMVTLDSEPEEIAQTLKERFNKPLPPNGLILPGDTSALATLAALIDIGRLPGVDTHLVVKQTSGIFGLVRPKISSVFEDITAAGELMADFLMQRIDGVEPQHLQCVQKIKERQ